MSADSVLNGGTPARRESGEWAADLVEAIYAYLHEIDGYRNVCLRGEATTIIQMHDAGLEVVRFYPHPEETMAHLRSTLGRLPSGGKPDCRDRSDDGREASASETGGYTSTLLHRFIAWENRPIIVSVCLARLDTTVLRVALFLPGLESDLPELPLRTLANALLCHEFLVPAFIAAPLPMLPEAPFLAVSEYLKRTMPSNLYASQCI